MICAGTSRSIADPAGTARAFDKTSCNSAILIAHRICLASGLKSASVTHKLMLMSGGMGISPLLAPD